MNKHQAERLAAKIREDDDAGAAVMWLLEYDDTGRWELVLMDHASGHMTTVGSPQDWKDRQEFAPCRTT